MKIGLRTTRTRDWNVFWAIVLCDSLLSITAGPGAAEVPACRTNLIQLRQILAQDLDADRRADTGREHVDARLDRRGPGFGDARKLPLMGWRELRSDTAWRVRVAGLLFSTHF